MLIIFYTSIQKLNAAVYVVPLVITDLSLKGFKTTIHILNDLKKK